jgi:hypothetical protein
MLLFLLFEDDCINHISCTLFLNQRGRNTKDKNVDDAAPGEDASAGVSMAGNPPKKKSKKAT